MKKSLMQAWTQAEPEEKHEKQSSSHRGRVSTIAGDPEQVKTTTIRLSEENIIFCNLMSKKTKGSSMSGYINSLIEKERSANPKESQKARQIRLIQNQ